MSRRRPGVVTEPETPAVPAALIAALDALIQPGQRRILGIVGAPGAGKSTLAMALHRSRPESTCVVPMDGFHLAQSALKALGRSGRKGAPDTFDALGYVALLKRIRAQRETDEALWAPAFCRTLEEPLAGAIAIAGSTPLVITEGNYLLLDDSPWQRVAPLLDEAWFLDVDDSTRLLRLQARHMAHGRSAAQASAWIDADEPNARRIDANRRRATRFFRWDGPPQSPS